VAPGLAADLVVVADLAEFHIDKVFKNGQLLVDHGSLTPASELPPPAAPTSPMRMKDLGMEAFSPPAAGSVVKVIGLIPDQLLTEKRLRPTPVREGRLATAPARDLLKLAVVERHHATGNLGLGMVQGFGLPQGALASSVAHDSHNIIVVGASEADMLQAVRHLADLGGGMAVVAGDRVLADLALPIAGLISPGPLDQVAAAYRRLKQAYHDLGGALPDPFMALSFLALPVIPALKLTDLGLVDVDRFQVVPLFGAD
jgi:adenine deaminase